MDGPEDNRAYECGKGTVLHVYLSPEHAGAKTATLASWYVVGIEGLVDDLTSRSVVFEKYDQPQSSRTTGASPRSGAAQRSRTSRIRTGTRSPWHRLGAATLRRKTDEKANRIPVDVVGRELGAMSGGGLSEARL